VFGTIVEQKVAILVDISGSMMSHMDELKHELASLIWDQLYPQKVRYVKHSMDQLPWLRLLYFLYSIVATS